MTVWLWIISLLLFFWPQGIAVIELAHRYPGEGGVYLWAKEVFGDFHGFLSGWCYWTNNMLYVPTVMLYFVGVSVFAMGPGHAGLADNKIFAMAGVVGIAGVAHRSEHCWSRRRKVAEQRRRHRNICGGGGADWPRNHGLVALRHHRDRGRFPHSAPIRASS